MLPALHKYNFTILLEKSLNFLSSKLPNELVVDTASSGSVLFWLAMADKLQLDNLRVMCEERVISHFSADRRIIHWDLCCKPTRCTEVTGGRSPAPGHGGGRCVKWCGRCYRWGCMHGECSVCGKVPSGDRSTIEVTQPPVTSVIRPGLPDLLQNMSRGTLENLLTSLLQTDPAGTIA